MSAMTLDDRLAALVEARELGAGRLDEAQLADLDRVVRRAEERRARSSEHTVVGFFGATGSGKSSLFNAVVGEDLARTHVTRPTTSEPLAAVWDAEGAAALLDWLEVRDRRTPARPFADDPSLPLILLDLPDFDSVAAEHREIATRLAGQVDVLVWVVDPQKYADATLHRDFIRPFAAHASVTAIVLNQLDLLAPDERRPVLQSLGELLRADGIPEVRVLGASARTGEGVDAVRAMIADFARRRVAATARLEADVRTVAANLAADVAPERGAVDVRASDRAATQRLAREVAAGAGVDTVAAAVAGSYRKRAGQATGWPLTSWLLRLRPDPLRRLRLGTGRDLATTGKGDPDLQRTSLPPLSAGQRAAIGRAVRGYAEDAAAGLPEGWQTGVRERAADALERLPDSLDLAIARTDLGAGRSWWWPIITVVQWLALLAALIGVGWYLAAWLLPIWGFPRPEITVVEGWPVPALLIAFGLLLGIVLGLLVALVSAGVAGMRRRRAERRMRASVGEVVAAEVVGPIRAEQVRAQEFLGALRRAA